MRVYKFGGASVKDAAGVRNLRSIVSGEDGLFVIVSAMGKTTNALERVFGCVQQGDAEGARQHIEALRTYHASVIDDLYHEPHRIASVDAMFDELQSLTVAGGYRSEDAEAWYDRIVAYGELVSTLIISDYLNRSGVPNEWIDMRRCIVTQQRHKDASVDLAASAGPLLARTSSSGVKVFIGQGFIGGAPDGTTTTLGREGSDYSAAVVAYILDAESMSVWKDVDGVLNADPKIFPEARKLDELSYLDAIELAYSGAQIIHPKTIKPLQNKNIPLYVRPFGDKRKAGTVIRATGARVNMPILILKRDMVVLNIRPRDFSFVLEERFDQIFSILARWRIKSHLIQNSAVNLSLCIDSSWHLAEAMNALRHEGFDVMHIGGVELLTVRGYTDELFDRYARGSEVIIRQASRSTLRVVRKG